MQVGKRMMEFDFNPRSPHGERRHVTTPLLPVARISIHAPRTGSDGNGEGNTLNARISIHAPRTGSDQQFQCGLTRCIRFQSTLPARGATESACRNENAGNISIHAPRTGSDQGDLDKETRLKLFQSTLPARGATLAGCDGAPSPKDFNPRSPHGERRGAACVVGNEPGYFNPRSPCGERGLK